MSWWPSSRRHGRRLGAHGLRLLLTAIVVATIAWGGGLAWYATKIPHPAVPSADTTDAIVVLTGGSERMAEGLRLLEGGMARKLFVSGVYHRVEVKELLRVARTNPGEIECCIELGYAADDTAGNARETAGWMAKEGFGSLRLVTASYHMPRSMLEFRDAMPAIEIVIHPVFPDGFKHAEWWLWPGSTSLISSEFGKYLMALVRIELP